MSATTRDRRAGSAPEAADGVETGTVVYAVVGAALDVSDLGQIAGFDDAPLRLVPHGPLAAVVSTAGVDRAGTARADLMAYSNVLDALAELGAAAPVSFGTVLLDDDAVLDELLAPDVERLEQALADLEGRCQLNLTARYVEEIVLGEVIASDPEVRRLREQTRDLPEDQSYAARVRLGERVSRAVEVLRERDAEALLEEVRPHVAAYSLRPAGGTERVLDAALLVDRERRAALEEHLETLAEAWHDRIRLRLVGPVAAFDFVGEGRWAS